MRADTPSKFLASNLTGAPRHDTGQLVYVTYVLLEHLTRGCVALGDGGHLAVVAVVGSCGFALF